MLMTLASLKAFLDELSEQYGENTGLILDLEPTKEKPTKFSEGLTFTAKAVTDESKNTYLAIAIIEPQEEKPKKKTTRKKTTAKKLL